MTLVEASRGAGAQCDMLWVGLALDEIEYLIFVIFRSGVKGKTRCLVPPLNIPCPPTSAENGEQSVLTLGSLCLPCCVRDSL